MLGVECILAMSKDLGSCMEKYFVTLLNSEDALSIGMLEA